MSVTSGVSQEKGMTPGKCGALLVLTQTLDRHLYSISIIRLFFQHLVICLKNLLVVAASLTILTSCGSNTIFKDFIYLFNFRERGREGKRGTETSSGRLSHTTTAGDLACNPGMCPDWESNWWRLGLGYDTHPTEPRQSGL